MSVWDRLSGALARLERRQAINAYLTRLPPRLARDYGHDGPYTPEQVERSLERERLPGKHIIYAWAIFCGEDQFPRVREHSKVSGGYAALRAEIGYAYFGGGEFTLSDVKDQCAHHSHVGASDGGHYGSHHGGFDGGGHH